MRVCAVSLEAFIHGKPLRAAITNKKKSDGLVGRELSLAQGKSLGLALNRESKTVELHPFSEHGSGTAASGDHALISGEQRMDEKGLETVWASCIRQLSDELPAQQFNTWIRPLRAKLFSGDASLGGGDSPASGFSWLHQTGLLKTGFKISF